MIAEERDRGLLNIRSCEAEVVPVASATLNEVECPMHQHQNGNDSNLEIGVHHGGLSDHSLENSSDPTTALFPHHQHHLQPHRHDLNGNTSSTDANHNAGSDLLQQQLLAHNTLHALNPHDQHPTLHHSEQQHHHQYQQQVQQQGHHPINLSHHSQQQQQHPFTYHHEQHNSRDEASDAIIESTSSLQDDVVDIVGLHQHPHPTDITPVSEHNHHMNSPRLMHQEHEHLSLGMVYPPHQYNQQYQQPQLLEQHDHHQDREQDHQLPSVDQRQTSVGMIHSVFPTSNLPLPLPPRRQPPRAKNSDSTSVRFHEGKRSSKSTNKGSLSTSKIAEKKRQIKRKDNGTNKVATEKGSLGITNAKKPRRRRYDNNFKAEVLDHLKGPHTKLSDVARYYGIPENTLREWTKIDVVRAIETARSKNSGQLKANMYDPMKRLSEKLMVFFEHNRRQPEHLRQSITTKLIVAKGLEARNSLLQRHATHPFLEPKEKKALENFSGSDSWAKKFAKRSDLKMTGTRIKELSEEDVNHIHQSLKQMSNRIKQAGPAFEDTAMLIRQASEKLLLASIIHSTASNRMVGERATTNSRNRRKSVQA